VYSLKEKDVKDFTTSDLIRDNRWTFFDVYFTLQKSSHPEKINILKKLETLKKDWIEENTSAIEKREKQEKLRKEKVNAENRKMIDEVMKAIASPNIKFSQKILHLFEKHPDLFDSSELVILKDQIRTMLSDNDFFDIKDKAEIYYNKEQKNSFTRPNYMSYGTLDKCYEI
jgi:hypothetical protein